MMFRFWILLMLMLAYNRDSSHTSIITDSLEEKVQNSIPVINEHTPGFINSLK